MKYVIIENLNINNTNNFDIIRREVEEKDFKEDCAGFDDNLGGGYCMRADHGTEWAATIHNMKRIAYCGNWKPDKYRNKFEIEGEDKIQ